MVLVALAVIKINVAKFILSFLDSQFMRVHIDKGQQDKGVMKVK